MTTGGALLRLLHPESLHRLYPEANGPARVPFGLGHRLLHRQINFLQILALLHVAHVPAEGRQGGERRLHREAVLGDSAGKFGVVIRDNEHKGVELFTSRQSGNRRQGLLGFTLHARPIGNHAKRQAVPLGQLITKRQPLGHRESGPERPVADENAFRVEMAFPVTGQLTLDPAEFFQVLESHSAESVLGAERVDPVLRVARIVDKVKGLVPGPALGCEHDPVDRRHRLGQRGRAAPVAGRPADHRVGVHQRDQGTGHDRICQRHLLSGRIFDLHRILRALGGRGSQPIGQLQGAQRGNLYGFHGSDFSGHTIAP